VVNPAAPFFGIPFTTQPRRADTSLTAPPTWRDMW
jgi:hypothetical protein